jgi:hypothetical protein
LRHHGVELGQPVWRDLACRHVGGRAWPLLDC